jgi:Chromo (CHRromatin Organisation MOdifier) domain
MLHAILNSSTNTSTEKSPHELMYGIALGDLLRSLSNPEAIPMQDFTMRDDAYEAMKFAAMYMKDMYDRKHTELHFDVGSYVYLKLHKGYNIPETMLLGPKLSRQRTGPFKILERVGRLAYRLEIPEHWRIHPVISIAHLEPAHADSFNRPTPDHPDAVFADEWEVEKAVNKRVKKLRGKEVVEYLIRWSGWGPEYDLWIKEKDLPNAHEAIQEYENSQANLPSTSRTTKRK